MVKVLNLVTLIWHEMTGKSALSVTKSAIEKKLRSKSLKLSQNVVHSISFHMKKLNTIVIAVRF